MGVTSRCPIKSILIAGDDLIGQSSYSTYAVSPLALLNRVLPYALASQCIQGWELGREGHSDSIYRMINRLQGCHGVRGPWYALLQVCSDERRHDLLPRHATLQFLVDLPHPDRAKWISTRTLAVLDLRMGT